MTEGRETQEKAVTDGETKPRTYRALHWKISPRETVLSARRYSVFVKFMKGALPLAALGLGIAVLAYALQPRDTGRIAMTFERIGRVQGDLTMVKPRLTGTDDEGQPFIVTAASAVQLGRGSDQVRLQDVAADISMKDGTALHVTAETGIVDTRTYVLDVTGVHITSADGYDARTASANADLKAGIVKGDSPIEAEGRFGRVTARRFALNRETRQLRFSGNVRMLLRGADEIRAEGPPPTVPIPSLRKIEE
jgi:lipopolysaccharide export system protein LptC